MPTSKEPQGATYGRVRSAADLGRLCRAERKRRGLTLAGL